MRTRLKSRLQFGAALSIVLSSSSGCTRDSSTTPNQAEASPVRNDAPASAEAPPSAAAGETSCVTPGPLQGVPSGNVGFNLYGGGEAAGTTRYLWMGDPLLFWAGEGGSGALTLWAKDDCGLWIRDARASSWLEVEDGEEPQIDVQFFVVPPHHDGTFYVAVANRDRIYTSQQTAPRLLVTPQSWPSYSVQLLDEIENYEGE
jgi:hypothetical protein